MLRNLYPERNQPPFIIVAPRYVRTSAGIKAMHLICHWLNRSGFRAYMHIDPPWYGDPFSFDLLTPRLTKDIVDECNKRKINAIFILPEVLYKNPFGQSGLVARFIGNYPGLLGGPAIFEPGELLIAYSRRIADELGSCFDILYVPTVDTSVFNEENATKNRSGSCAYTGKFSDVHGGKPFGLPSGTVIFDRDDIGGLNQNEIRDLFQRKEYFFAFEDTALSLEAALCGCVPVLMINKYFEKPLGLSELGYAGHAIGFSPAELDRARASLPELRKYYESEIERFPENLCRLAKRLVHASQDKAFVNDILWPKEEKYRLVYAGRPLTLTSILQYIRVRGVRKLLLNAIRISNLRLK